MQIICRKLVIILLLVLVACAVPQLFHRQLVSLNLGMEPALTIQKLGLPPLEARTVKIDGKEYLFHRYNLNNGVNSDTYFLAFENVHLRYWGYIDDFKRHPDSRLNRAIDALLSDSRSP